MIKVAQYAAQLEDYDKAIQIYEQVIAPLFYNFFFVSITVSTMLKKKLFSFCQVASSCLDSSLLKYSAKEYFFRASLCHLSVDLLNAQHALEKYSQQYPAFQDSREYKLVKVSEIFFFFFFCSKRGRLVRNRKGIWIQTWYSTIPPENREDLNEKLSATIRKTFFFVCKL